MQAQDYLAEREELGWYFAGVGPTVGLRSGSLDGAGGGIYDEAASRRDHLRHFEPEHRAQVRRLKAVQSALGRVAMLDRTALERVHTPFGAGRASYRLVTAIAIEGQSLIGLAIHMTSTEQLYHAKMKRVGTVFDHPPTPPHVLLAYLEDEVSTLKRGNRIPQGHRLHNVLDDSRDRWNQALDAYSAHRRDVQRELAAVRDQERSQRMAAMVRSMGGGRPS